MSDFVKLAEANAGILVGINVPETRRAENPTPEKVVNEGNELCYDDHVST
ncbi:hypothetical protein [Acidovorax radicis]|nr:hypothetical protein [Acidovorax radicis]UCU97986.1 hypothetical protein KI609_15740 [Acidovorax radicis]